MKKVIAFEDCNCGKVVIRISHQLLADMLKNCEKSYDRDVLIRFLRDMEKSDNLKAWLDREKIWDLLEEQE